MSEMNEKNPVVNTEEAPINAEDKKPTVVINHVMYPENTIGEILNSMSTMTVTGAENILKFADVYRTLSQGGQLVPVSVEVDR